MVDTLGGVAAPRLVEPDFTPNRPEIVAELRERFERYDAALAAGDVPALDAAFWDSEHTIRYAISEQAHGFDAIHAQRLAAPPGRGALHQRTRVEVLTIGRDLGTVNMEFAIPGTDVLGRQSQVWVRFPADGWKVVLAHVSTLLDRYPGSG